MSINLWPSKDTFHEFHNNPEYQNFKLLRHDHSDDALIQVAGEDIAKNLGYIKNMTDPITLLGLVAGMLTTAAFLPQVVKSWKSKSTKDVSLGMFLVLCIGIVLWLIYGFLTDDIPLIAANGVTLFFAGTILVFKIRYK
jgi:MtN3 and saliva related transmembrane protein